MTDVVLPKRKASELEEDPSTAVDGENGLNKRARKGTEEADETVEGTSNKDSEGDLGDDLAALEKDPVQMKRTRGVRIDYTELQVDVEENQGKDEGKEEEEDDDDDDDDEEDDQDDGEAATEEQQTQDVESTAAADIYTGENGIKGEQASEEGDDNDNDNYEEDDEDDE